MPSNTKDVLNEPLQLSPLVPDDCLALWQWRNDAQTRSMSLNTDAVSLENHLAWFDSVMTDPTQYLYMASIVAKNLNEESGKVGFLRFDLASIVSQQEQSYALVSINLNPKFRGKGLSVKLLSEGIKAFVNALGSQERSGFVPVYLKAIIKPTNIASIKCFEAVGFTRSPAIDNHETDYVYLQLISSLHS